MITPQEFAEKMRKYARNHDTEDGHARADALMCTVLASLGYQEGVKIFEEMERWYA